MDGECRYPEKVCWIKHDPAKKGQKAVEENASSQLVFQGWIESSSRKKEEKDEGYRLGEGEGAEYFGRDRWRNSSCVPAGWIKIKVYSVLSHFAKCCDLRVKVLRDCPK